MQGNNFYDPGLHLFLDDVEVQDHPGFVRKVQRPERVRTEPVLKPDRPWEGKAVQLWGSVLYDDDENCFKMWYYSSNNDLYERTGQGHFMCYATSKDGVAWEKPELGIVACEGSSANNIVYPPPGVHYGLDPWGVVKDPQEQDPSKRYKMGMYQQRPTADAPQETPTMDRQERNALRKVLFDKIRDHHGMYAAFSPDGIHWRLDDRNYVPRSGDAGALVYDPMQRRYLATSRRYETLMDHFVLEWKQYRRVIALSSSEDFVHWTPLKTIVKPDDFDDPRDQLYVMTPFVYGNQYIGFIGMLHSATELGPVQLATARHLDHWQRVGRREEFLPVGSPGAWDGAWASLSSNPPALVGDTLYMWYSGRPQAHGTEGNSTSSIGLVTLGKDRFVALRCGIGGGELMTEPIEVVGPRLGVNATCLFGNLQVRVIAEASVPEGFDFDSCNGLARGDETDCEITWGQERRDLTPFVGREIRLHFRVDNATSLYAYRTGDRSRV